MARQEATVKVWFKDGSGSEIHTPDNARDLVMHAGWHRTNPKITAIQAVAQAEEMLDSTSFDEAEKEAASVKEAAAKAAKKADAKPAKAGKAKPTK